MASISTNKKDGTRRIIFAGANGRKIIHLGKMPLRDVREIKTKVEALNVASLANVSVAKETAQWVGGLDARLYGKLVAVGLVSARETMAEAVAEEPITLGPFLDAYIESRDDVKGSTATAYGNVRRNLLSYFGSEKPLAKITKVDATEFRRYLARPKAKKGEGPKAKNGEGLAENTIKRRCAIAKQYFLYAVGKKLISENPFGEMKFLAVRGNVSRDFYISREMADRVIDACPDAQWRLLFALSRYGGLRCPSEHLGLRWGDINWAGSRFTVHSPKTEHHEGKSSRVVPLFPELRQYLDEVFEQAADGTEYVITRYRAKNCNLRPQLQRIIKKAGLEPWPKLFQNLRATRQTELASALPSHVVCEWLGNSEAVAKEHYLQVTEAHFEQATNPTRNPTRSGAKPGKTETNGTKVDWGLPRENADSSETDDETNRPGRTRTYDQGIMSPLL